MADFLSFWKTADPLVLAQDVVGASVVLEVVLVDGMEGDAPMPCLEEREELASLDAELIILDCRCEDDIIAQAQDADAILTYGGPMTRRVMEKLAPCQCIVRYGIGYDTVDTEAATEQQHGADRRQADSLDPLEPFEASAEALQERGKL